MLIERLNDARQAVLAVPEREHVTISHGRVIREGQLYIDYDEETGEPIARIDPGRGERVLGGEQGYAAEVSNVAAR